MIDWTRVTELRDELGAEDFNEIVDIFLSEVDDAITDLGNGEATIGEQLHFLKGSALNLGFEAFAELCSKGENATETSLNGDALTAISTCYQTSRATFISEMQRHFEA